MTNKEIVKQVVTNFDAKKEVKDIVNWIKEYAIDNHMKKAILGISGGKDSTIVAAILVQALGKENVIGLLMPNGKQEDIFDSYKVVELLDIEFIDINIEDKYLASVKCFEDSGIELTEEARINIAPICRMETLSTFGQSLGARLCGTGNASEKLVGYFTKRGDGQCDFNPIANYTSLEVMALGEALGLPDELVYKTPADGLSSLTDEEKLGISYVDIHNYIRKTGNVDEDTKDKIREKEIRAKHKLVVAPSYIPQFKQ